MKGGGFFGVAGANRGDWKHLDSTASHQQIHLPQTAPTRDLSMFQHDIHLRIRMSYCENTRPSIQMGAALEQHKGLYTIIQEASATLRRFHTIPLGMSGTTYKNHTQKHLRTWVLNLKELRSLLPSCICILMMDNVIRIRSCFYTKAQRPSKPDVCMTINKAQGQALNRAGNFLCNLCFFHGQL
jgi:hypothetical protein